MTARTRKTKTIGDAQARKIADFLLGEGLIQKKIAEAVGRSQSWVAGVKKENDLLRLGMAHGRPILQGEIIENVEERAARWILSGNRKLPK